MFFIKISRKIYDDNNFSAYRRSLVFVVRAILNYKKMQKLRKFLDGNSLRRDITEVQPAIFEQVTRCIFYRGSTFAKRLQLITDHLSFLENSFTQDALRQIYLGNGITLWNSNFYNETISLELGMHDNYHREGLMGLILKIEGKPVYTVMFWIELNNISEPILKIGALQGKRNGLDVNRALTKYFFGFRPKDFILFGLRTFSAQITIKQIYGVSNFGDYANNHIRINTKLKTSLDEFWDETGGKVCNDPRFFEIPIISTRKNIEDAVSHKRNLYRKRYSLLNEVSRTIEESLNLYMMDNTWDSRSML